LDQRSDAIYAVRGNGFLKHMVRRVRVGEIARFGEANLAISLLTQKRSDMDTIIILTATLVGSVATAWAIQRAILEVCLKAIDPNRR
jgi:hypothetical protein